MAYKKLPVPVILVFALLVSCVTVPKSGPQEGDSTVENRTDEAFDPTRVTRQQYDTTREEVQQFIDELNRIIRNRNYDAWRARLSPEYFAEISSKEHLQQVSEQPAMRTRRIVIRTAEDYFIHVVVPSRANLRVDDIEFISRNRVKAFTVTTNKAGEEQRLRLYDLERIGNSWRIIN
ncbi:MAG: hypothetical protein LBQ93_07995 [Treponema sp.]|jgi:hypothetical protein|nr:hypothetical protein [Treponema sp.]